MGGLEAATLLVPIGEGAGDCSGDPAGDSYTAIFSWMELDLTAWAPCVDSFDRDMRRSTGFLKLTGGGRARVWLVLGSLIRGPRRLKLTGGCVGNEVGMTTGMGLGTRWGILGLNGVLKGADYVGGMLGVKGKLKGADWRLETLLQHRGLVYQVL